MIIPESNGGLVLELLYHFVKIAMDKFLKLMIPDVTPRHWNGSPPNENEIKSPTWYLLRSNSRKFYHRKSLHFETIMEMSENQMDLEVSNLDPAQEENKSNSSFNQDLEEFKIYMIDQRTVHSSPKLVTSHFEDSGFLNCSIEMTSRLETISEIQSPQEEKSSGHDISFDFCLRGEEENSRSWSEGEENSKSIMNRDFVAESGDQNSQELYSPKYSSRGARPSNDKFIAEIMKVHDSVDDIEIGPAHNQSIADNVCGYDPADIKLNDITSTN